MAGLLDGKRILVTGVLTPDSIAFHVAKIAIEEGAQVVLSSYGRVLRLTTRTARRLPSEVPVVELDVADDELDRRRAELVHPTPRYTSGVLAKYARLAAGAEFGAVTVA